MKAQNKLKFTQTWVDEVEPQTKLVNYYDTDTSGLQLTVNPGGKKTYRLYISVNNEPVKRKIGEARNPTTKIGMSLKDARIKCDTLRNQIRESGVAPDKYMGVKADTLDDLYAIVEKHHFPLIRKGTRRHYEMSYRLYVQPILGKMKADKITKKMVVELRTDTKDEIGESSANKVIMVINLIYNTCIKLGFWNGISPAKNVDRFDKVERDRYLDEEERKILWGEIESDEEHGYRSFIKLCLLTGQRSHNIAEMKWKHLDLDAGTWIIPAEEMKSGETHLVRLTDDAIKVIKEHAQGETYVLHNRSRADSQLMLWRAKWARNRGRYGLEDVTIHDLRRTFGCILAQNQFSLHAIASALGQKSLSATSIYARLNAKAMIDAFTTVQNVLREDLK